MNRTGGGAIPQPHGYTLWIEAEELAPGEWTPADANTDVIVTFDDASRWAATLLSYANIQTLTENNRRTGECLADAFFWASDMILIDEWPARCWHRVCSNVSDEPLRAVMPTACDDEQEVGP